MWCDQLRRVSEFCGVHVLTYAVLDNHFHLLVHVPPAGKLMDAEIVERYRALYPHRPRLAGEVERTLGGGGAPAARLRERMWFNARFKSFGTVWAERFKSLLVEDDASTIRTVGAYIDLNAVRASIVKKPEHYRWCGMAAAERGDSPARRGLMTIERTKDWPEARRLYRRFVYEAGLGRLQETDAAPAAADIKDLEGLRTAAKALGCRQR
jgi:REP element-mobilizing transposase RayT